MLTYAFNQQASGEMKNTGGTGKLTKSVVIAEGEHDEGCAADGNRCEEEIFTLLSRRHVVSLFSMVQLNSH